MSWPRFVGLALALGLHGGAVAMMLARSDPDALAEGSGSDNLNVVQR